MLEHVKRLAAEYDMLPRDSLVLCAVSGGADSMCLLHLLMSLSREVGFQVAAAHFDHRIRGDESARDAAFVAEWCALHGVRCVMGEGDVLLEADLQGQGVEETARQLRYAFLRRAAESLGAVRIATAHNADDNVETLLLHLVRGTGLQGLTGIPPRRGEVVRPLLTTSRAEIMDYLEAFHVPHRTDSSNSDEAYTRNRLRRQVIPVLRELNPKLSTGVAETIASLRADNDYLNAQAARACMAARWAEDDLVIEASVIASLPPAVAPRAARRLLEMLGDGETVNCSAAHLRSLVELCRGDDPSAVVSLPGGRLAQRVYRDLLLTTQRAPLPPLIPVPLALDGETEVEDTGWRIRCSPCRCPADIERAPGSFYLAREKLQGGLVVRAREIGDEVALPKRGTKTVKKLFIDEKVPRRERERIPVLADRGGVVAVAGFGPDQSRVAAPGEPAYAVTIRRD